MVIWKMYNPQPNWFLSSSLLNLIQLQAGFSDMNLIEIQSLTKMLQNIYSDVDLLVFGGCGSAAEHKCSWAWTDELMTGILK